MANHARLGPSNHRWVHCPGSIREEAAYPNVSGAAAIDGTGSHLLLETAILNGVSPQVYLGQRLGVNDPDKSNGWVINQDRIDRVLVCTDYIRRRYHELVEQYPGADVSLYSEVRSNPGERYGRDDWWGTVDIVIRVTSGSKLLSLDICDYKDGRGYVTEVNNTQLISYALGLIPTDTDDNVPVRMTIVQPKSANSIRSQDSTVGDLLQRGDLLAKAASLTDDPDAPLIADNKGGKDYCRWCKHRNSCPALNKRNEITGVENLDLLNIIPSQIHHMSNDDISKSLEVIQRVNDLKGLIEAEATKRLTNGTKIPKYTLTKSRSTNKWFGSDEAMEEIFTAYGVKEMHTVKLFSPTQLLKSKELTKAQKDEIKENYVVSVSKEVLKRVEEEKTHTEDEINLMFKQEV